MLKNEFIYLRLKLEKQFVPLLLNAIDEEILKTSEKWKLNLNSEDCTLIKNMTLAQVKRKIIHVLKNDWDLTDKNAPIVVSARYYGGKSSVLDLPNVNLTGTPFYFLKTKDGWEINPEITDESVPASKIYDKILEDIVEWAKVAAYYGTASFAGNE